MIGSLVIETARELIHARMAPATGQGQSDVVEQLGTHIMECGGEKQITDI